MIPPHRIRPRKTSAVLPGQQTLLSFLHISIPRPTAVRPNNTPKAMTSISSSSNRNKVSLQTSLIQYLTPFSTLLSHLPAPPQRQFTLFIQIPHHLSYWSPFFPAPVPHHHTTQKTYQSHLLYHPTLQNNRGLRFSSTDPNPHYITLSYPSRTQTAAGHY